MKRKRSGGARTHRPVSLLSFRVHPTLSLLILLLLGALVSVRAAQPSPFDDPHKPYALIFGTVWGPDNYPVYGAKVKIRRADQKKAKWELISNHTGEFAQRVPAGKADYVVWIEAKDLKGLKSSQGNQLQPDTEVTVSIANDERKDIGLHLK